MAKNDKDYAVIVGIKTYPAFDPDGPLEGPENDARAFYEWVESPAGGNVPDKNIKLIVSSDYGGPFATPQDAKPLASDIQRAFEDLQDKADANAEKGKGLQVGRRLYIFMAGHGFAPRDDQTALLMANATRNRTGPMYHILGQYTADWFFKAKYFEEVVLLMDCCREAHTIQGLNMSWSELVSPGAVDKVRRFYGYGTKWSRLSREKTIGGVRRGIFTTTLIKALEGGAADPITGEITAESLKDYLYTNMEALLDPADMNNDDVPKEPEVDYYPKKGKGFVLMNMPVPEYKVTINIPAVSVGKAANVLDGGSLKSVEQVAAVPNPWVVNLKRGKYLVQILADGLQKVIHVDGTGDINESL